MNVTATISAIIGEPTVADSPFDIGLFNDTLGSPEIINGTTGASISLDDGEGSYFLNTLLGFLIIVIASALNAFGLNLTKLDHVRQQSIPKRERKKEYLRVLWLAGMGTYIASQVFGSPLALRFMRPDWVAPLGSSSLIFNFLFAHWLVGTPVTPTDIQGTAVIVLGVILILVFSSINHGLQQSLNIERLNSLWGRGGWIAYFVFVSLFTASTYLVSSLFAAVLASRASFSPLPSPTLELPSARPTKTNPIIDALRRITGLHRRLRKAATSRLERLFSRTDDARITWLEGMGWAVAGGSLAGLCLVFTKAVVKIYWLPGHPLLHVSSMLSLLLVILTAVLQIICLNRALVCADTVVVVPLFYAGYTVLGFIDSLLFFNESGQYARWVLVAVFVSIAVLLSGVVLLSLKSSAKTATDPYTVSARPGPSMRLRPRARASMGTETDADELKQVEHVDSEDETGEGPSKEDVLWEVGSVSDGSETHEGEGQRRGIGGGSRGGERRGLLFEEEAEEGRSAETRENNGPTHDGASISEGDGDFGEYEGDKPASPSTLDHLTQ